MNHYERDTFTNGLLQELHKMDATVMAYYTRDSLVVRFLDSIAQVNISDLNASDRYCASWLIKAHIIEWAMDVALHTFFGEERYCAGVQFFTKECNGHLEVIRRNCRYVYWGEK